MGTLQVVTGVLTGRRANWTVVVFWLVIVAVAGPLSGKLTGAEKNDSSAWRPARAESTKVPDLQSRFESANISTGAVVYARLGSAADSANSVKGIDGTLLMATLLIVTIVVRSVLVTALNLDLGRWI